MSIFPSFQFFTSQPESSGLQGTALACFFARSVTTPRRLQSASSFLEELLVVYFQTTTARSSLHSVVNATALATYGIRLKNEQALQEARAAYGVAIGELSKDLACSDETPIEATILSIYLCLWYEFFMCLWEGRGFLDLHEKGLVSILQSCHRSWFQDGTVRGRILAAARHKVANDCLELGVSASGKLEQAAPILRADHDDPGLWLTSLVIRTADFLSAHKETLCLLSKQRILRLLQDAQTIDSELEQWTGSMPSHWAFTRKNDASWTDQYAYDGRTDLYYDIQIASIWNCYRRARLMLLELIARASQTSMLSDEPDCATLGRRALVSIRTLAEDICGSVPYHLGTRSASKEGRDVVFPRLENREVDAVHWQSAVIQGWFLITLPLARLTKMAMLEEKQHQWALEQYARICAIVGRKHGTTGQHVSETFETAVPVFASALPINSRHLRDDIDDQSESNSTRNNNASIANASLSPVVNGPTPNARSTASDLRCWDHDCHGRHFANRSNLERHRKERLSSKWTCESCGLSFTRRSAKKAHIQRNRCSSS